MKFGLKTAARAQFDADIHRLAIVGEVSPATTNIAAGEQTKAFYVVQVSLRNMNYDTASIALLSRLIEQNMLFILEHDGKARLAVYRTKLLQSDWQPLETLKIKLTGLNFDTVWGNIIAQVGGIQIEDNRTIDEQLALDTERAKLKRQIDRLERQAVSEKQPRRKWIC
jgi:hypothetical protein